MVDIPNAPTAWEFLWRWAWTAFARSLGPADLLSSALGALAAYLIGDSPPVMSELAWKIPVFSLAAVTMLRLAVAPYWIWRQEREDVVRLAKRLQPSLAII